MGVSADECSVLLTCWASGRTTPRPTGSREGGAALARALEERVRAAGVEVRTGCEVVGLDCEAPRRLAGFRVRTPDGAREALAADVAIVTVHRSGSRR